MACVMACVQPAFAAPVTSSDCAPINRRQAATSEAKCYSIEHGGLTRTFRVYAPVGLKKPVPLVMVLHGGGGSGGNMEWLTQRGFNRIADRDGAVIVYPDGISKGWNDGRSDMKTKAVAEQIDDVGFLRALAHALAAMFPIDPKRIYVTGISNGGMMSNRLACDAADVFAAAAPVAGDLSVDVAPRCKPARPVSIASFNGTDDPVVPWGGGQVKVLWAKRGAVISAQETLEEWRKLDRCGEQRDGAVVDSVREDATSIVEHSSSCAEGTEVRLYEIRGGGHTWPGGEAYLGERLVGRVSREIDANEVIWKFFQQHRLP